MKPTGDDDGEANAGEEVACGLVVTGSDATPVLELAESDPP